MLVSEYHNSKRQESVRAEAREKRSAQRRQSLGWKAKCSPQPTRGKGQNVAQKTADESQGDRVAKSLLDR